MVARRPFRRSADLGDLQCGLYDPGSAGLVTFSQAVGVIIGATFGTTSTPWLVAIFGFRLRISAFALPMIGIGAFLWIIAKGKTRSAGAIPAGFGLLLRATEDRRSRRSTTAAGERFLLGST